MPLIKKIFLGIFTILPALFALLYGIIFFSFFFEMVLENPHYPDDTHNNFPEFIQSFFPMAIMIFVAALAGFALMIYYIVHISKNEKFDTVQRLLWILIIVFTHTLGQIVYFILEIWPSNPEKDTAH